MCMNLQYVRFCRYRLLGDCFASKSRFEAPLLLLYHCCCYIACLPSSRGTFFFFFFVTASPKYQTFYLQMYLTVPSSTTPKIVSPPRLAYYVHLRRPPTLSLSLTRGPSNVASLMRTAGDSGWNTHSATNKLSLALEFAAATELPPERPFPPPPPTPAPPPPPPSCPPPPPDPPPPPPTLTVAFPEWKVLPV